MLEELFELFEAMLESTPEDWIITPLGIGSRRL